MTEELKPHQIAQLVNKLRDIATKYHAHGCLRELISREVNAALTQRPAAQDEREADEVFLPRRLAATQKLTQLGYRYDSAHGKWLPAPQQATPEPVGEPFGYFRALPFGWEQCGEHDDGAVALYTRPAPDGWTEADADAARLAMELECLLLDTKTPQQSRAGGNQRTMRLTCTEHGSQPPRRREVQRE